MAEPAFPQNYLDPDVYETMGFAPLVKHAGTLYLAGVAPLKGGMAGLDVVGTTMAQQLAATLDVVATSLAMEGLGPDAILSWTIYTTDVGALSACVPEVLLPWLGGHRPACTIIGSNGMFHPQQMIEITVTARC